MNTSITGRHFELTETIKAYAENSIASLDLYNLNIISANTVISANQKQGKKGFEVEFIINLKDKHSITVHQVDKDVYAAMDLAIERVKKNLRRYSDKIKSHKNESIKTNENSEVESTLEFDPRDIEIVPMDLELHKPLEFDDALESLFSSENKQFLVFNDHEGIMRVMYKRNDNKVGLY